MSFLTDAQSWLADTLLEHASIEVTYSRGAESTTLNAVVGRSNDQRETPGDKSYTRIDAVWVDFHIDDADLVADFASPTPAEGDQITVGSIVREVRPMEGRPAVEQSDSFGELTMLHTLRVS